MRLRLSWPTLLLAVASVLGPLALSTRSRQVSSPGSVPGSVEVTPDGGTLSVTAHATGYSANFTIKNTRFTTTTFTLSCSTTGQLSACDVEPNSVTLDPNEETDRLVTFSTGNLSATGNTLTLTAGGPATDAGTYSVNITTSLIRMITPEGSQNDSTITLRRRQPQLLARFLTSAGHPTDSASIQLLWQRTGIDGAALDMTTAARRNRGLIEWLVEDTLALANPGDSARVTVRHCTTTGICTEERRKVVLANDSKPIIGFSGVPTGALAAGFGAPFGPGFSVSGPEVETGFGTVPYFTMGTARSAGLVYSTRQAWPRVSIPVDVDLPWLGANPSSLTLIAWDGAVFMDSARYTTPTCLTGAVRRCRGVVTADFRSTTSTPAARKWLKIEVRVVPSGGGAFISATDSVEVALVDRRTTRYGAGWWPAGAMQLIAAGEDRILVGADGAVTVFRGNGDSLYLPPPGDFSVLKKLTGPLWELTPRGSPAKLVFDAQGRLIKRADQNGNRDTLLYGGSADSLVEIRDPMDRRITLGYSSGKLSSFTTLAGTGQARTHTVTIDGATNQLTRDSIGGAPYRTVYSYATRDAATKTHLIATRLGLIQDTTRIVYDSSVASFTWRPSAVKLPRVPNEVGTIVVPQINYTPVLRRGAGTVVPLDSTGAWVELRDPKGNWTRSFLNRWGQALLVWDTLGILGRTRYLADGRVQWSEGKVAGDVTRTYAAYDNERRLVKRWINRVENGNGILRLDSLVYDASHRVIKEIDARNKITTLVYDAVGRDTMIINPNNDTVRTTYLSNGQVSAVRAPGDTGRTRYSYEAAFGNLLRVTAPSGDTIATSTYDSLGRPVSQVQKTIVQTVDESPGTRGYQWTRQETFYTLSNQVDSSRLAHSDTCVGTGCTLPASWNWDTLHATRAALRYDRAGRDSVRLGASSQATTYLYDALGRLLSRRPPSDSAAAPRDSMVYDLAGNLVKTITRRGDTLTASYDSRNRLLTRVIPGVGTVNQTYGGSLDQLTRIWLTGATDPIGAVNGEIRYGYDQRGRMLTDTAYMGATAVVTQRVLNVYEQDSVVTDPLGTWRYTYEANRGFVTQVVAPTGDTLKYTYDTKGRATGPSVWYNGIKNKRAPSFNLDGAMTGLVDSAWGAPWEIGRYAEKAVRNDDGVSRLPLWIQRKNSFGYTMPDTLEESPIYDGWQRLTGWTQKKNGTQIGSYTYSYDTDGNIATTGGAEIYAANTDRLLSRTDGAGHLWKYFYDRAGNLVTARDSLIGSAATVWTYTYDALDRLTAVSRTGVTGPVARYGYDLLGRRIVKRVYSSATGGTAQYLRMVYRGNRVTFEADSLGSAIGWKYIWGLGVDQLVVAVNGSGHHTISTDRLGSVRAVQLSGAWLQFQWYTPYGEVTTVEGTSAGLRYGWTGREYDAESGLYFHRARYYDPRQRRFTQEDPIGYSGGGNLYAYVSGRPLERVDPNGTDDAYPNTAFDPCPGFDTCWESNPADALEEWAQSRWDDWWRRNGPNREEKKGESVDQCPAWLSEQAVINAVNDVWDASQAAQPDQLGRVPEFGAVLSGEPGSLSSGPLIEGSHDPNDAFGVTPEWTPGKDFVLIHSHPNSGKPFPEFKAGYRFGDQLSGKYGSTERGDWQFATKGLWVVAVVKSNNSRRLGLRIGSPDGKSSTCSVAKRASTP